MLLVIIRLVGFLRKIVFDIFLNIFQTFVFFPTWIYWEECQFVSPEFKSPLFIITIVRTRLVTNRNSVGFARKKAQTISFVERGFERLGLGHQVVGFSWCSYMVKSFSP